MEKQKPLISSDNEVRELSETDFSRFKPAQSALSASLQQKLGIRGPQKEPKKTRITIRLSPEVIDAFKASGAGWQTRIDEALKGLIKNQA